MNIKSLVPDKTEAVMLLFIIAVAAWRVLAVWLMPDSAAMANFTPVGAMALFGGACFSRTRAYIFPLLTLWLSDILLYRLVYYGEWTLFYDGIAWTYLAFALMVLAGSRIRPDRSVGRFAGASLTAVFIHWIVADTGVWLSGTLYPMTAEGFWLCLVVAIPYEAALLGGTLVYGGVMFGLFERARGTFPSLKAESHSDGSHSARSHLAGSYPVGSGTDGSDPTKP